ncbi:DUF3106 domain-containing protein [Limnohabitans sp. Jir72]|uniref:DUF3106 domain-containing protein n=1 Tax=Limnohabitans sp. Jir72 TaxID=1977909 RepID=UPI000D3AA583|nr:DUF3106 domain-containing protein [Limnohabitans sp. Jir72]PUE27994.1 hypothetical protein B9Z52_15100 [Limnohabitans sp. Jir72]
MTEAKNRETDTADMVKLCCGIALTACFLSSAAQTAPAPVPSITAAANAGSNWQALKPQQKLALAPLAAQWGSLTPQQQSKWLAISQNFTQLPANEQAIMHTRMADWVGMSPQQRNQARFNYYAIQSLSTEDKKAKWEAYQALSAEDKRLLSAGTTGPAKSAATISKPAETVRLVAPQARAIDSAKDITRTGGSTQPLDRKTLLPKVPKAANTQQPTDSPSHSEGSTS